MFQADIEDEERQALNEKEIEIDEATADIEKKIKHILQNNIIVTEAITSKFVKQVEAGDRDIIKSICAYSNQYIFNQIETNAASVFLNIRSKLRYVSFPRFGSVAPPSGEGTIVAEAIKKLRQLNQTIGDKLGKREKPSSEEVKALVKEINNLFWHPRVPDEQLIDLDDETQRTEWKKQLKKGKYIQSTQPRNNDLKILYYVTAVHLDTIASCFSIFNNQELSKEMTQEFINIISNNWSLSSKQQKEFFDIVCELRSTGESKLRAEATKLARAVPQHPPLAAGTSNPVVFSKPSNKASASVEAEDIPEEEHPTRSAKKQKIEKGEKGVSNEKEPDETGKTKAAKQTSSDQASDDHKKRKHP